MVIMLLLAYTYVKTKRQTISPYNLTTSFCIVVVYIHSVCIHSLSTIYIVFVYTVYPNIYTLNLYFHTY